MNRICGALRTHPVLRRPQILLVGLILLVGCSDDGDPSTVERADVTSTSAEETTTTEAAATTTTLEPCPEEVSSPEGGEGEGETEVAPADVDGDGEADLLSSRTTGTDTWRLDVELARGGAAALELQTFGGPVGVVGGADVDGDGAGEIWARTGAGASTTILGLFQVDGCELAQVTFGTGGTADLPVGGSVGTSSGVECSDDGGLLAFTATYLSDGSDDRYQVETVAYELDGSTLVAGERTTTEIAATDPEFVRYTSFSCGDLLL